jgi:two-component system, cell cycle sensor histidine kinase and response regulator CckA
MGNKSKRSHPRRTLASGELLAISVCAVLLFFCSKYFDLFERLSTWMEKFETGFLQVDELFIVSIFLAFAFGVFSFRRWREFTVEVSSQLKTATRDLEQELARHVRTEKALAKSERVFENAFDYAPSGIVLASMDGHFLQVNRFFCEMFGFSKEEFLTQDFTSITRREDLEASLENMRQLRAGEAETCHFEKRYVHKLGHEVWGLTNLSMVRDSNDNPLHFIAQVLGISERKRAEQTLLQSESRFRLLCEAAPLGVFLANREGSYLFTNQYLQTVAGFSLDESLGDGFTRFIHPEDKERVITEWIAAVGVRAEYHSQYRFVRPDGTARWVNVRTAPFFMNGILAGNVGTVEDITEHRQIEEMLKGRELQFAEAQRTAHLGSWQFDVATGEVLWSDELWRIFGLTPRAFGLSFEEYLAMVHKDDQAVVKSANEKSQQEKTEFAYDYRIVHPDGTVRFLRARGRVIVDEDGHMIRIAGTDQDITELKQAEEKQIESQQWLQAILTASRDGIIVEDNGKVVYTNRSYAQMLGYDTPEDIVGCHISEILPPEEAERMGEFNAARLRGESPPSIYEFKAKRRDGSLIRVEASVSSSTVAGRTYISTAIRDVRERKQAESALAESEERLRQSQKMEAIGTLAGGVAHDFNNLLTVILGNTELAFGMIQPADPVRPRLDEVEKAANRAIVLTRQLLAFSRRQLMERRNINLNDTIGELIKFLNRIIGADVEVNLKTGSNLSAIFADPAQIEQVVMNLAVNARDAMPHGGRLDIETSNVELDDSFQRLYPDVLPGKYVLITVSDNGTGMDQETKARLFEPFFTTKEVGRGTGLGLSMVYGIVKQSDGHINVYSELGHGTTFKIYLPIVESAIEKAALAIQAPVVGGTETILVAEDDDALRYLARDMLNDLGYTVMLARDGKEALEIYAKRRELIDLMLLDVMMPRMGGTETYERIRQLGGDVPSIFMTGYSSEIVRSRFVDQEMLLEDLDAIIIQKPYSGETLGRKIREVLDVSRARVLTLG